MTVILKNFIIFSILSNLGLTSAMAILPINKLAKELAEESLTRYRKKNAKKISWVESQLEIALSKVVDKPQDVESLSQLRNEFHLRQDLFHRLSYGIESYYKGGSLSQFLARYLLKISHIEIKSGGYNSPLWKITAYMSQALKKSEENIENPIEFLDSYLDFSGISHPRLPKEFLMTRNYTNGFHYQQGKPKHKSMAADNLRKKLQEHKKPLKQVTAPISIQINPAPVSTFKPDRQGKGSNKH